MSAPSASGCCRYGVANVLSTTSSAPRSCATLGDRGDVDDRRAAGWSASRSTPSRCRPPRARRARRGRVRSTASNAQARAARAPARRAGTCRRTRRRAGRRGRPGRAARSTASSAASPLANAKPSAAPSSDGEARLERGARRVARAARTRSRGARRPRPARTSTPGGSAATTAPVAGSGVLPGVDGAGLEPVAVRRRRHVIRRAGREEREHVGAGEDADRVAAVEHEHRRAALEPLDGDVDGLADADRRAAAGSITSPTGRSSTDRVGERVVHAAALATAPAHLGRRQRRSRPFTTGICDTPNSRMQR